MKKAIFSIILCFMLVTTLSNTALAATNLGTLSCWYSDSDYIARWDKSSITVYTNKLNSNGSFYFSMGTYFGCSKWDDALEIKISSSSSDTSAPIKFYGGTRDEVNAFGDVTISQLNNGVTQYTSSVEGTWKYGNTSKTGRLMSSAVGYIIDNGRTTDEYEKTCAHEIGHALGWAGHSSNSSDIMYSYGSSVTSLTTRDSEHLSQVYSN